MKSRPTKQKLKQRGILKERVFGCDLGEHLLNSGQDGTDLPISVDLSVLHLQMSSGVARLDRLYRLLEKMYLICSIVSFKSCIFCVHVEGHTLGGLRIKWF